MIKDNLHTLLTNLPETVQLVAVSKTKPVSFIEEAYTCGQRVFGENKVQELVEKHEVLSKDIDWHFIGHLQSNKVKYIAPFVSLIHGVDSFKLLKEINKQALRNKRVIDVLLQFHIANEVHKFGFQLDQAHEILSQSDFLALKNIRITGVMGMATFTDNENQVRDEFKNLHAIFNTLKNSCFKSALTFKTISMGMSGDYQIAIEEGSTMVRIGSSIFGKR